MNSKINIVSVKTLLDKVSKMILEPVYQRELVWNEKKISAFVDSLMKGYVPGNIIINEKKTIWTCIDGKQRINSIIRFCSNNTPIITKDTNDEEQYIFFSNIPETYKKKPNIIKLSIEQQQEFHNKELSFIVYTNLSHNEQCDLFNRIQNSMSLTAGERIFSLFKNLEVAQKFKNFCKKYDYTKKGRFRNVDIFINFMYMQKNRSVEALTGKKKIKFIELIDNMPEYDKLINIIEPHIPIFFSEHLMCHTDIINKKITKNFIIVLFYLLLNEQTKINTINEKYYSNVRNMILRIWKKWYNIDGKNKELGKMSINILQKIELIYLDNNNIMGKIHNNSEIIEKDSSDEDTE